MTMTPKRVRDFRIDVWGVALVLALLAVPLIGSTPLVASFANQIAIGVVAALAVYITMRMRLLSFTVPAFMAVGGYATAIVSTSGGNNLILLLLVAFLVPVLFAIPLGFLVLRLRGVYFIFFTFILNEVFQIAIFETPGLTGGSDGISGVPPAALFGITFGAPNRVVLVTVIVGILAAVVTLAVTERFRAEFSAIEENEPLAESLGLVVWRYRMIGFLASAGVSGLAGFALVHQLSVAHPSEFTSFAAVNYIAYAVVGGTGSMLGPVVGAMLMVTMSNLFSTKGLYASALFGVLLTSVVMIAPDGLVGEARKLFASRRRPMSRGKVR